MRYVVYVLNGGDIKRLLLEQGLKVDYLLTVKL